MRAASKQINEVKNMTGQSAGEDYLHFNTKEIGLVERAEKEWGEKREAFTKLR